MAEERTLRPPEILLLAGPNGAGKTTSSRILVPDGMVFVNADIIARRLADEGHPPAGLDITAGRVVLAEIRRLADSQVSFCLETNLAGRGMLRSIDRWRAAGYWVRMVFVALHSPELALARVDQRVADGGHDIPEAVIRRRWQHGLNAFFRLYLGKVDTWTLIDNSDAAPVTVARGLLAASPEILDFPRWTYFRALGGD